MRFARRKDRRKASPVGPSSGARRARAAGLIAALSLVPAAPRASPALGVPWRADPECRRLVRAMRRLPPTTPMSDWPYRVSMKGLTFPRWTPADAAAHLDDVMKVYWRGDAPDSPSIEARWTASVRYKLLAQIRSGEVTLSDTTIDIGSREGAVSFWLVRERLDEDLDMEGKLRHGVRSYQYSTLIKNAKLFPDLKDVPLNTNLNYRGSIGTSPTIPIFIDGNFALITQSGLVLADFAIGTTESGIVPRCSLNYKDFR